MEPTDEAAGYNVGIRYPFGCGMFWGMRYREGFGLEDLHECIIDRDDVYLAGIFEVFVPSIAGNMRSRARRTLTARSA